MTTMEPLVIKPHVAGSEAVEPLPERYTLMLVGGWYAIDVPTANRIDGVPCCGRPGVVTA
jgi:hypothetical protein